MAIPPELMNVPSSIQEMIVKLSSIFNPGGNFFYFLVSNVKIEISLQFLSQNPGIVTGKMKIC